MIIDETPGVDRKTLVQEMRSEGIDVPILPEERLEVAAALTHILILIAAFYVRYLPSNHMNAGRPIRVIMNAFEQITREISK